MNRIARSMRLCGHPDNVAPCILIDVPDILVRLEGNSVELRPNPERLNAHFSIDSHGNIDVPNNSQAIIIFGRDPRSNVPFSWSQIKTDERRQRDCDGMIGFPDHPPGNFLILPPNLHESDTHILIDATTDIEYCYQITVLDDAGMAVNHDPKIYNMDTGGDWDEGEPGRTVAESTGKAGTTE